jgi:hypothetical protein
LNLNTKVMEYRGYKIEPETDPWAIKYGYFFKFYRDEKIHPAKSIEEAKEEIDELTNKPN